MSKLGFDVQALRRKTQYDARLLAMPLGGMVIIGDTSCLPYALQFTGRCPVVFRFSALDDSNHGGKYASRYGQGDPAAAGTAFVEELRHLIYDVPGYRQLYYQCGWDEKKGNWEWNRDFTIAALREADKDSLKLCVINLYWGNPPEVGRFPQDGIDGWDILWPAVVEAAARPERALIGLHAYIDPAAELSVEGQRHALTRPLHLVEKARAAGLKVRIAVTETGWTVSYPQTKIPSLRVAGNQLWAVDLLFQAYPEVEFEAVYTLDMLDGGGDFPADREIFDVIEAYAKASPAMQGPLTQTPALHPPDPAAGNYQVLTPVNIRESPNTDEPEAGRLYAGHVVRIASTIKRSNGDCWGVVAGQGYFVAISYQGRQLLRPITQGV